MSEEEENIDLEPSNITFLIFAVLGTLSLIIGAPGIICGIFILAVPVYICIAIWSKTSHLSVTTRLISLIIFLLLLFIIGMYILGLMWQANGPYSGLADY